MADRSPQDKIKEAKNIEKELKIDDLSIRNFIDYLRVTASDKSSFVPCGCIRSNLQVSPSFHRAFKTFTYEQKADYYFKIVQLLKSCIDGQFEFIDLQSQQIKGLTLNFFNEDQGNWEIRKVDINYTKKGLRFKHSQQEIDMHYYILRNSKKKDKKSLALESTQNFQNPITIRVSNYKQSLQQLKNLLEKLILSAMKQNFMKKLSNANKLFPKSERNSQIVLSKQQMEKSQTSIIDVPKRDEKLQNEEDKSDMAHRQTAHFAVQGIGFQKKKVILMNSLNNYADLTQTTKGVYIDIKNNRVRKVFQVNQQEYKIPLQWFGDNLMTSSGFRNWKKSLREVRTLGQYRQPQGQKIFYESHGYKQQINLGYLYKRQRYQTSSECLYFFDIAVPNPHPIQFPQLDNQNKIQYVIWKFQRSSRGLVIVVEGKINHKNVSPGSLSTSLTEQFLGEIDRLCSGSSYNFQEDTSFRINSAFFQDLYLSQFMEEIANQNEFHSIIITPDQNNNGGDDTNSVILPADILKTTNMIRVKSGDAPSRHQVQPETMQHPDHLLKGKHPQVPLARPKHPKFKFPEEAGKNPFWQNEFKFGKKGEMICVNAKKMEAQKGVLLALAKSVGRNLFSGKSILNISMPVTIFSYDSNLSLLCKSFCYGPKLLERAAKQTDPQARFKNVVAFAFGCTNAYIQMDKPFNPILGETYQCLIDNCLVYGEQTSHHPPISSIFMKGRGYTTYGSFEAKVNLSLNSATGSNEGVTYVSFDQKNIKKKVIKFNVPPGEVGGIMWGDRTLKCVDRTQYLDQENRLFLQLKFGKHKGLTQFCKYDNGIEGVLVKLKPEVDLSKFPNLNIDKKQIEQELGIFSGKWTQFLLYQEEPVFNYCEQYPHVPENYPCALESDAFFRKDLLLRIEDKLEEAQTAKEELQNIQRNDRKLRAKYHGGHE